MLLLNRPIGRRAQASVTPIGAELSGSDICTALGITVRGHAPILLPCRRLIEAGHDSNRPLHTYRDETLCLTISSMSAGACLEVNAKGTGFIRHPAVRTAPPIAPTAKRLIQPPKQAAARRARSSYDLNDLAETIAPHLPGMAPPRAANSWRAMVGHCLAYEQLLRPREREFVTSLLDWRGKLTPRQNDSLTTIYERLRREGAA
jgi:hypothetical protein